MVSNPTDILFLLFFLTSGRTFHNSYKNCCSVRLLFFLASYRGVSFSVFLSPGMSLKQRKRRSWSLLGLSWVFLGMFVTRKNVMPIYLLHSLTFKVDWGDETRVTMLIVASNVMVLVMDVANNNKQNTIYILCT